MKDTRKIMLVGLPMAGKSSFIAAFWYLVDGQHNTRLTLKKLDGNREYLDSLRDKWLTYEDLERTKIPNEQVASMKLTAQDNNDSLDFVIPDLSGETFKNQWLTRSWTSKFENLLLGSDGLLLFVHPSQIIEATRVEQAEAIAKAMVDSLHIPMDEEKIELAEWDAENVPTQVKLVELLQFIEEASIVSMPYKISVVISAWDEVKVLGKPPAKWLKDYLPLLHQYLLSKNTIFPSKIYGVSAQGAPNAEFEKLTGNLEIGDRIQVVTENYDGHDISIPLAWLLEKE